LVQESGSLEMASDDVGVNDACASGPERDSSLFQTATDARVVKDVNVCVPNNQS
jgi:hypothetical protein